MAWVASLRTIASLTKMRDEGTTWISSVPSAAVPTAPAAGTGLSETPAGRVSPLLMSLTGMSCE